MRLLPLGFCALVCVTPLAHGEILEFKAPHFSINLPAGWNKFVPPPPGVLLQAKSRDGKQTLSLTALPGDGERYATLARQSVKEALGKKLWKSGSDVLVQVGRLPAIRFLSRGPDGSAATVRSIADHGTIYLITNLVDPGGDPKDSDVEQAVESFRVLSPPAGVPGVRSNSSNTPFFDPLAQVMPETFHLGAWVGLLVCGAVALGLVIFLSRRLMERCESFTFKANSSGQANPRRRISRW